MANYPGRRKGTRRIVLWSKGTSKEWIVPGTKADGDRFEAEKRLELEASGPAPRNAQRFAHVSQVYASSVAEALSSSTWRARRHILVGLSEFFGERKLTDNWLPSIDEYRRVRTRARISVASVNTEIATLLYVLRWAKDHGYAVTVPRVKMPKPPQGRVRIWTPAEVERLLAVVRVEDPWLLPMVLFLVNTGCRKGEAIAAEWSWVDFERAMVRIPATTEWKPKSGRAREVPMGDVLRAVLSAPRRSERWVFPNRDGNRFALFPDARFKEMQTKAGVTGGAHTLRHVYASQFLQAKPDMFLLAEVLGHTHVRMTALYSHLLPSHLEAARNVVNIGGTMATAPAEPLANGTK